MRLRAGLGARGVGRVADVGGGQDPAGADVGRRGRGAGPVAARLPQAAGQRRGRGDQEYDDTPGVRHRTPQPSVTGMLAMLPSGAGAARGPGGLASARARGARGDGCRPARRRPGDGRGLRRRSRHPLAGAARPLPRPALRRPCPLGALRARAVPTSRSSTASRSARRSGTRPASGCPALRQIAAIPFYVRALGGRFGRGITVESVMHRARPHEEFWYLAGVGAVTARGGHRVGAAAPPARPGQGAGVPREQQAGEHPAVRAVRLRAARGDQPARRPGPVADVADRRMTT